MAKPKTSRTKAPAAAPAARASASPTASVISPAELEALLEVMARHDATELEEVRGDHRLVLRRGAAMASPLVQHAAHLGAHVGHVAHGPAHAPAAHAAPAAPAAPPAAAPKADDDAQYVTSPLVGTFYRAPSPEAPAFVDVGARIRKGQRLCIVEAMKLMNEIESEVEGTIVEILVENGKPVEYGQRLFKVAR